MYVSVAGEMDSYSQDGDVERGPTTMTGCRDSFTAYHQLSSLRAMRLIPSVHAHLFAPRRRHRTVPVYRDASRLNAFALSSCFTFAMHSGLNVLLRSWKMAI